MFIFYVYSDKVERMEGNNKWKNLLKSFFFILTRIEIRGKVEIHRLVDWSPQPRLETKEFWRHFNEFHQTEY